MPGILFLISSSCREDMLPVKAILSNTRLATLDVASFIIFIPELSV